MREIFISLSKAFPKFPFHYRHCIYVIVFLVFGVMWIILRRIFTINWEIYLALCVVGTWRRILRSLREETRAMFAKEWQLKSLKCQPVLQSKGSLIIEIYITSSVSLSFVYWQKVNLRIKQGRATIRPFENEEREIYCAWKTGIEWITMFYIHSSNIKVSNKLAT